MNKDDTVFLRHMSRSANFTHPKMLYEMAASKYDE